MLERSCYTWGMTTKRPKRPRDANQLAKSIVDLTTGDAEEEKPLTGKAKSGHHGGKARAKALTDEQKKEIARAAANARWKRG